MKRISQERFEALSYARVHTGLNLTTEIEWYANDGHTLLGIVFHDNIDKDYSYIVLGRDETGIFRCIAVKVSMKTITEARYELNLAIIEEGKNGDTEFPQGDRDPGRQLLLHPLGSSRTNPNFNKLITQVEYSPAKEIITEIAYAFKDPDGNYIQQFQTDGFNSRLWELYLYAFFHEEKFSINRDEVAPDFHIEKYGANIFIEAVTVNPSPSMPKQPSNEAEIQSLLPDFMPIRYGSSLYSKLNRGSKANYWDMEHVKGNPFIIAIHDYSYEDSMEWSRSALETYLYGYKHGNIWESFRKNPSGEKVLEHTWEGKVIQSAFFEQPNAENVSAILFSNSATIEKFNRMGYLADFGDENLRMIRTGKAFNGRSGLTESFEKKLVKSRYKETWGEGLVMFHNPHALFPTPESLFPGIAHMVLESGRWSILCHAFYPITSKTQVIYKK